jgi:GTP-binding protein
MRAAGADEALRLAPPQEMTLDRAIEWIDDDELVEVTPTAIRVRTRVLAANQRPRTRKGAA